MRGRTNITQKSGAVPVNGDVISAEVIENNISTGDFVSYGTIESVTQILNTTGGGIYNDVKEIGNNLYVVLIKGYLYLMKYKNQNMEMLNIYNDYVISCFTILPDNSIICGLTVSPGAIRLIIQNNSFILSNVANGGYHIGENNSDYCFVYDNKFCIPYGEGKYLYLLVYDLDEEYNIIFNSKLSCTIGNTYYYKGTAGGFLSFNNFIFFTFSIEENYSSFCKATIDFVNKKITSEFFSNLGTSKTFSLEGSFRCLFFNKYYLFVRANTISFINLEVKNGIINKSLTDIINNYDYRYAPYCQKFDNDKIIMSYYLGSKGSFTILQFLENSGDISLYSNILETKWFPLNIAIIDKNNFGIIYISSNNVELKNIETSEEYTIISEEIDKTVVKPWSENERAIGFAKTSGNVGDIIDVYVPSSTT